MRKGNRGKFSGARRYTDKRIDVCANQKSLIGLTAKVVSNAPPVFKGRCGKIEAINGKKVDLSFSDGRYENQLTIPLEGLHIYTTTKGPNGQTGNLIRFK